MPIVRKYYCIEAQCDNADCPAKVSLRALYGCSAINTYVPNIHRVYGHDKISAKQSLKESGWFADWNKSKFLCPICKEK